MPGKQMAIDADLNAGLINQAQAQARRKDVAGEADFYGAMDGASKFVRGDAIAGMMILAINLIGDNEQRITIVRFQLDRILQTRAGNGRWLVFTQNIELALDAQLHRRVVGGHGQNRRRRHRRGRVQRFTDGQFQARSIDCGMAHLHAGEHATDKHSDRAAGKTGH